MQTDNELSPQVCEQASDSSSSGTPCLPQTPLELLESSSEPGFHAAAHCLPQHTDQATLSSLPHSKKTVQK